VLHLPWIMLLPWPDLHESRPAPSMPRSLLILAMSIGLSALRAQDLMYTWDSPTGAIRAEAYVQKSGDRTIFLFNPSKPSERVLLCTFDRDAQLLFSYNDSWIALNDFAGSSESYIRLFKRIDGLKYQESTIKADGISWKLLQQNRKVPFPTELTHAYARVVQWGGESLTMLVELSGHTDTNAHLDSRS